MSNKLKLIILLSFVCISFGMQRTAQLGARFAPAVSAAAFRTIKPTNVNTNLQKYFHTTPAMFMNTSEARKILNLPTSGKLTEKEIKNARNKIIKEKHTDVGGTHEEMLKINEAVDLLKKNPEKLNFSNQPTEEKKSKFKSYLRLKGHQLWHYFIQYVINKAAESGEFISVISSTLLAGRFDMIDGLLEKAIAAGTNLNETNEDGNTLLYTAIIAFESYFLPEKVNKNYVVKSLLKAGADPNVKSNSGEAPLHAAIEKGYIDIANTLIKAGANPNAINNSGQTPLHIAAEYSDADFADVLIKAGAYVNEKDNVGETPLDIAVQKKYADVVEILLKSGADLQQYHLEWAAKLGNLDLVKILIKAGLDVNGKNGEVLLNAIKLGRADLVEFLLKAGATLNDDIIIAAARLGNADIIKSLIKAGLDINKTLKNGSTFLILNSNNYEGLKALLEAGANPNAVDAEGRTALYWAAMSNDEAVKELLKFGADPNIRSKDGTPLHNAATVHPEAFHALLEAGADMQALNYANRTPYDVALSGGAGREFRKILLNYDVANNNLNKVESLIKKFHLNPAEESYGKTPLDIARGMNNIPMINLLEKIEAEMPKELIFVKELTEEENQEDKKHDWKKYAGAGIAGAGALSAGTSLYLANKDAEPEIIQDEENLPSKEVIQEILNQQAEKNPALPINALEDVGQETIDKIQQELDLLKISYKMNE